MPNSRAVLFWPGIYDRRNFCLSSCPVRHDLWPPLDPLTNCTKLSGRGSEIHPPEISATSVFGHGPKRLCPGPIEDQMEVCFGQRAAIAVGLRQMHYLNMHTFPPAEDLRFLIGLEIAQICLDPWSTQLRFSEGGQITVEGKFEHLAADGSLWVHQSREILDNGPVFLRALIQQRVDKLETEPLMLTLHFSKGDIIRIHSDEGPYECGQIYTPRQPDKPIVF